MMNVSRPCPVCGCESVTANLFIEKSIDVNKITRFSFSSRKEPEYMSHRLVQCRKCDLIFADQPPSQNELAQAYHAADFDSSAEAEAAALAYIKAIKPTLKCLAGRTSALEIGTGTGIFLELLAKEGFRDLVGVEPSAAAVSTAPAHRQAWIQLGVFEESCFLPESFDLICCFMTMEHVYDPKGIASSAFRLLRPGGSFVIVTHDYRGITNRLLGDRSPIIDIEHLQLFSKRSIKFLFDSCGFRDIAVRHFSNSYSLRYWLRLMPLPSLVKRLLMRILSIHGLGDVKWRANVGNLVTTGFKPQHS